MLAFSLCRVSVHSAVEDPEGLKGGSLGCVALAPSTPGSALGAGLNFQPPASKSARGLEFFNEHASHPHISRRLGNRCQQALARPSKGSLEWLLHGRGSLPVGDHTEVLKQLYATMMKEQATDYLLYAKGWDDKAKELAISHFEEKEKRGKFFNW